MRGFRALFSLKFMPFPSLERFSSSSRQKVKGIVHFLYEMGVSGESIENVLTRWPNVKSHSVEDKLQPNAMYLRSLGINVSALILRNPHIFGLSVETNLKPVTEFFLAKGFSEEEIATMISRLSSLYSYSLTECLIPKWDFFMTTDYSKSDIVEFPYYFRYSLEERIKTRYANVKEIGGSMPLNKLLFTSSSNFDKLLKAEISVAGREPTILKIKDASRNDLKQKAITRVSESKLRPNILYLQELGMNLDQMKGMARRYPNFAYCSLERKIIPLVRFLTELGIPKSYIPIIFHKRPQILKVSLNDNIIPTMAFLERLGVDKTKWAKVIYHFPSILTLSRKKVKDLVDFLYGIGLSEESIGKILTRWPQIAGCSVQDKLQPTAKYFRSLGVDVSVLILQAPSVFGLNIETNLEPVTEFFLDKGYNMEEVGTMISKYSPLYSFSLTESLMPKWDFFLTMDYSKSCLVQFPQYFSYSFEERIKPRYALVKEFGISMPLSQLLSPSGPNFLTHLKAQMKKRNGQTS